MLSQRRYLEFAVAVIVVACLSLWMFRALQLASEDIESAAVQAEVAAMRVELMDRVAHREIVGGALPIGRNPVDWTNRKPVGYVGEFKQAPVGDKIWYFDLTRQELVYRFGSGREQRYRLALHEAGGGAPGKLAGIGLNAAESVK